MAVAKKKIARRISAKKADNKPVIIIKSKSEGHPGFEKKVKDMKRLLRSAKLLPH